MVWILSLNPSCDRLEPELSQNGVAGAGAQSKWCGSIAGAGAGAQSKWCGSIAGGGGAAFKAIFNSSVRYWFIRRAVTSLIALFVSKYQIRYSCY